MRRLRESDRRETRANPQSKKGRVKLGHALELLPGMGMPGLLLELINREAKTVEFDEVLLSEDSTAMPLSTHRKLKC